MNQMYYIQKINEIVSFKGEIMIQHKFGLYEKALPRDLALSEKLRIAKDLGFDYFEMKAKNFRHALPQINLRSLRSERQSKLTTCRS